MRLGGLAAASIALAVVAMAGVPPAARAGSPPEDYKARFDAAIALHDRGQYDAAIAAFRDLLAEHPDDATLQCEMGNSLLAAGKADEAAEHAERGLDLPGANRAFCSIILGSALDARGDLKKGEKVFRKAIKESPGVAMLHFNLGVNQSGQGRMPEAIEEFQASLSLNPRHAGSWRALAIGWQGQRLRPRAFAAFARFLFLEPTGPRAREAVRQMGPLLFQGVENQGADPATGKGRISITMDSSVEKADKTAAALDLAMSTVAANRWLDEWKDRSDAEHFANAFDTIFKIFEEMDDSGGRKDGFWSASVMPFFREARAAGHMGTMAWDVRRAGEDRDVATWLEAHPDQVAASRQWTAAWRPGTPAADSGP